jgi:hypothetical protein
VKIKNKHLKSRGTQLSQLCQAALKIKDAEQLLSEAVHLMVPLLPASDIDRVLRHRNATGALAIGFEGAVLDGAAALYGSAAMYSIPLFGQRDDVAKALAVVQALESPEPLA